MKEDELLEKIISIINDTLVNTNLQGGEDIANLGIGDFPEWDSLGHLKIAIALESSLNIKLNSDEIFSMKTIADILDVVKVKHE